MRFRHTFIIPASAFFPHLLIQISRIFCNRRCPIFSVNQFFQSAFPDVQNPLCQISCNDYLTKFLTPKTLYSGMYRGIGVGRNCQACESRRAGRFVLPV